MPTVLPTRPTIRRRRRLRLRRPTPYWIAATTLALLTGLVVSRLLGAAGAGADGEMATVVVMTRAVAAGEPVDVGDTEVRQVPAALVPDGARDAPLAGEVAVVDLHAGEVLLAARLAPAGMSATAALLPPGTRGVAIPLGTGAPALQQGDRVDVLATIEPGLGAEEGATGGAPTFPVARSAPVVATGGDGEAVTVAVTREEAPRVAFALSAGTVTLSLVGADE